MRFMFKIIAAQTGTNRFISSALVNEPRAMKDPWVRGGKDRGKISRGAFIGWLT
jgi:hypothetical protein